MASETPHPIEQERRRQLEQLEVAETALCTNLHRHGLDETGRAHLERALAHVREAYIAVNEPGKSRSVARLIHDLEKVERLTSKLKQQPTNSLHV